LKIKFNLARYSISRNQILKFPDFINTRIWNNMDRKGLKNLSELEVQRSNAIQIIIFKDFISQIPYKSEFLIKSLLSAELM